MDTLQDTLQDTANSVLATTNRKKITKLFMVKSTNKNRSVSQFISSLIWCSHLSQVI